MIRWPGMYIIKHSSDISVIYVGKCMNKCIEFNSHFYPTTGFDTLESELKAQYALTTKHGINDLQDGGKRIVLYQAIKKVEGKKMVYMAGSVTIDTT